MAFLFEHDLFGKPVSTHRVEARGRAFPDHALAARHHRPRSGGRESGAQVVHSHDSGPVGNVEHCGQNQWAHRQPHGPLQSLPATIWPRGTTVMLGGLQKTGRSRAWAFDAKQTTAEIAKAEHRRRERRIILFPSPLSAAGAFDEDRRSFHSRSNKACCDSRPRPPHRPARRSRWRAWSARRSCGRATGSPSCRRGSRRARAWSA